MTYEEKLGNDVIDLRDLEGEEKKKFSEAIEKDTGYDFKNVLENEPSLIRDSYFEEYAQELAEELGLIQELAEELGLIDDFSKWPSTCIDWKNAARELQYDYTTFEIEGYQYWFRAF